MCNSVKYAKREIDVLLNSANSVNSMTLSPVNNTIKFTETRYCQVMAKGYVNTSFTTRRRRYFVYYLNYVENQTKWIAG